MAQTPKQPVQLVVTFLGAVENLEPGYMADQFKIVGCDSDFKVGGVHTDKDKENAGLVLWFPNFIGDKKESEDLTRAVAQHLDKIKATEGLSFRFVGAFEREGDSSIHRHHASRDGYAIAVTPKPAPAK